MRKIKLAIVAGIILIIPFIIVFQLSKADINIGDLTHPINANEANFVCGSGDGSLTCTYFSSPSNIIQVTESEDKWIVQGICVTTVGGNFNKAILENPQANFAPPPFDTFDDCINIILFDKDMYLRSLEFNSETNETINTFTLVNPNTFESNQMNLIGG